MCNSPFTTRTVSCHISVGSGLRRDLLLYLLIVFKFVCKLFYEKMSGGLNFRTSNIVTALTTVVTTSTSNYFALLRQKTSGKQGSLIIII
jgi:hypothetical protein